MTISSGSNRQTFSGNTATFNYTKEVFEEDGSDVWVQLLDTNGDVQEPTLDGAGTYDFTIAGTYTAATGRYESGVVVTTNTTVPTGWTVAIECRPILKQSTQYTDGGDLSQQQLETDFDRQLVMSKVQDQQFDDALRIPAAVSGSFDTQLPTPAAGKLLKVNDAGTAYENGPSATDIADAVANAAAAAASATAAAASATAASSSATSAAASAAAAGAAASGFQFATTAGTGSAYTVDFGEDITYSDGVTVRIEAHADNSANCTLNADGLGAKKILDGARQLYAGEFLTGDILTLVYDEGADGGSGAFIISAGLQTVVYAYRVTGAIADGALDPKLDDHVMYAGDIILTQVALKAGTATVTFDIGGTPLGGTANSASTTLNTQAHSSANTRAVGNEFNATISSASSAEDLTMRVWVRE